MQFLAIAAELQPGNRIKTVSLPLLATNEEVNCVSLYSTVATNNPQYTSGDFNAVFRDVVKCVHIFCKRVMTS